jgi:glycosyltransferase involved in cell wall biosynthesis
MKTVSIAVCTYNGEEFIAAQLQSLNEQTLLPSEIIICDDASTDRTVEIVTHFIKDASFPVKLFVNSQRLGFSRNFQKAANLCNSELIALCDQDDVWLPEKLQRCVNMFDAPNVLLCHHNCSVVDRDLRVLVHLGDDCGPYRAGIHRSTLDPRRNPRGCTMVFSRALLDFGDKWLASISYDEEHFVMETHDEWFYGLAAGLGPVAYLNEPLVLYRQHGRNVTPYYFLKNRVYVKLRIKFLCKVLPASAKSFERRAKLFAEIAENTDGDLKENAQQAAIRYRKLTRDLESRLEVRKVRNILGRIFKLARLVYGGAYGPRRNGGPGVESLLADLYFCVFHPADPL